MKPGLVLSNELGSKRLEQKKDRIYQFSEDTSFNKSSQSKSGGESGNKRGISTDTEYAVLLDSSKPYEEQNRIGRQLFVSLFITGTVTGQEISEEDLKKYDVLDDNLAMMLSVQIDRQVTNARKFLPFHVHDSGKHRQLFFPTGCVNTGDVLSTLIEQTVLLLKHNQHFTSLSLPDQTELMESNAMVAAVISCCSLYNPQSRNLTWPLAEQDFKYFNTLNM